MLRRLLIAVSVLAAVVVAGFGAVIALDTPNAGGWAGVAVPRVIALSLLDDIGLAWFQGLPAIHFATDAKANDHRTPVYSFRLAASLQIGRDWRGALSLISAPTETLVGANDELFKPDQFKPMLQSVNPRIGVTIVPNEIQHDRRSTGHGCRRRRLAEVGRRLTGR
jgi:hypothetical protein